MKILKIDEAGLGLIKQFEGLKLNAYLCPANVATIGYGATYYPNGKKVNMGDKITQQDAEVLLLNTLIPFEKGVDSFTTDAINQNQFNALVSFAYNCGLQNLKGSTLLKKVNTNINDDSISLEFSKWNKGGGKVLAGLTRRRKAESDMYFKK